MVNYWRIMEMVLVPCDFGTQGQDILTARSKLIHKCGFSRTTVDYWPLYLITRA